MLTGPLHREAGRRSRQQALSSQRFSQHPDVLNDISFADRLPPSPVTRRGRARHGSAASLWCGGNPRGAHDWWLPVSGHEHEGPSRRPGRLRRPGWRNGPRMTGRVEAKAKVVTCGESRSQLPTRPPGGPEGPPRAMCSRTRTGAGRTPSPQLPVRRSDVGAGRGERGAGVGRTAVDGRTIVCRTSAERRARTRASAKPQMGLAVTVAGGKSGTEAAANAVDVRWPKNLQGWSGGARER